MFLVFVLFLVLLSFIEKEGFTEADAPKLIENYNRIDKSIKGYANIFNQLD